MTTQQNEHTFKLNDLAVVNSPDSKYHGETCRIAGFLMPDGQPAARIILAGGVERKILLSKLTPAIPVQPVAFVSTLPKPSFIPRLPDWARPGQVMKRGDELERGDVLYFSKIANPRQLHIQLKPGHWKSTVIVDAYGYSRRIPNQIVSIDMGTWYVVGAVIG